MFNKETILQTLNDENYYIDKHSLLLFLSDWNIDAIYEDENGLEFYDDLAIEKIKRGISLKTQGYDDEQIVEKLRKIEPKVDKKNIVVEEKTELVKPILIKDMLETTTKEEVNANPNTGADLINTNQQCNNFTLDVSSQTLQMLAEAVAKKISDDITNSDMAKQLIEAGGYKRDNEILAKQVKELLEHNKELSNRIEQLEHPSSKSFWSRFWGQR